MRSLLNIISEFNTLEMITILPLCLLFMFFILLNIIRFRSLTPLKRVFLVTAVFLAVFITGTAISFHSLSRSFQPYLGESKEYYEKYLKDYDAVLLGNLDLRRSLKKGEIIAGENLKTALAGMDDLLAIASDSAYRSFHGEKNNIQADPRYDNIFGRNRTTLTPDEIIRTEAFLDSFSKVTWQEISSLVLSNCTYAYYFKIPEVREARKVIMKYLYQIDRLDISRAISTLLKLSTINEHFNGSLTTKVFSASVQKMISEFIHYRICDGKLTKSESAAIYNDISECMSMNFGHRKAMQNEFISFQNYLAILYGRAPIAMWLLALAQGDPLILWQKLQEKSAEGQHPLTPDDITPSLLMWQMFPHINKAESAIDIPSTYMIITQAELALIDGIPDRPNDAWGNPLIASATAAGTAIFYSTGPDGKDANGSGDDIVIRPSPVSIYRIFKR